jgi:hypothetical protein
MRAPQYCFRRSAIVEVTMLRKASILFAVLFLAGVSPSYAQRQAATGAQRQAATGAVQVRIVRVGFIVGGGGGEGNLTYRGKVYPFSVSGISVGTIGATSTGSRWPPRQPPQSLRYRR